MSTRQSPVRDTVIERLEKATGPDRGLDDEIAGAVLAIHGTIRLLGMSDDEKPVHVFSYPDGSRGTALQYTASIDAALTLLPDEDHHWKAGYSKHVRHNAEVRNLMHSYKGVFIGEHDHSRAIAICIAALRARETPA